MINFHISQFRLHCKLYSDNWMCNIYHLCTVKPTLIISQYCMPAACHVTQLWPITLEHFSTSYNDIQEYPTVWLENTEHNLFNKSNWWAQTSTKASLVIIQSMDLEDFQNFTGDLLVQRHICDGNKLFMKISSVFHTYDQNVGKNAHLAMSNDPLKIPLSRSACGQLQKFNKFHLVQRYTCGKLFTTIQSVVFT